MRKRFDEQFKATVALEAVKEEHTLRELAEKYQLHPNQISAWKKTLQEQSATIFEKKNKKDEEYNQLKKGKEELFRQLGEMQYQNEWLKKVPTAIRKRSRLIEPKEQRWSIRTQCSLLGGTRSSMYYRARPRRRRDEHYDEAIRHIAETKPLYGDRNVALELNQETAALTEKQVRRIMHIERLWRTVKYEDMYLQGYEDRVSLKRGLRSYFRFYNQGRFHQNLDYETPDQRYESFKIQALEA